GLAPTDIVVEVESANVSYIDLLMLTGQYHHRPPLPYTPGLEYAGTVRWVGADVPSTAPQPGDRVMSDYLLTGPRSAGRHQTWGGWASYAVAPHAALLRVPEGLGADEACNLLLNVETAHFAFVTRAHLQRGETVLITGATGAAGLAAIRVAKLLGAGRVIATGRGAARLEAATRQGADHVIDLLGLAPGDPNGLRERVREATDGRGADVLFDTVGGEWLMDAVRSLAFMGRMVVIGWAANTGVASPGGRGGSLAPDQLPTNLIQIKGLTVLGSPMVIAGQRDPSARAPRLAAIQHWMREGLLRPVVGRRFPLSSLREAMSARLGGNVIGGCVVHPGAGDDRLTGSESA
ncbi:MAG TPA: zinc-binding dehydrogenase, partial [Burkholderiaceae bacterium]|nr:zinc-binding dehydrogenase [Burkholderiaceae bacterium]